MSQVNEQAADLLEAAALVIQLPGWWTRRYYARNAMDSAVGIDSSDACAFCGIGAFYAADMDISSPPAARHIASVAMHKAAGGDMAVFNDNHAKSGKQVAHLMLRAAEELRGEK